MTFLSSAKSYYMKIFRLIKVASLSFYHNDCYTKASTLTFYTLQSLVPILAFAIGIAKGFGFEEYLEKELTQTFSEQKEIVVYAIQFAHSLLSQITGSLVVGFGLLMLLWTSLNLLGYVEIALNSIWKIRSPRTIFQKVKDFLAILIICPTVFIVSSVITVYIKEYTTYIHTYFFIEKLLAYLFFLIKLLVPLALSCVLFFLLYVLIPNTKVRVWPRVIAAVVAGVAFQIWQIIYIDFQVKIFNYSVVYGTFAVLPLFLIWLQFSWLIALAGAEIAAQIEYGSYLELGAAKRKIKSIGRKQLSLLILYHCLKCFYSRTTPISDFQLSRQLKIPLDNIQEILELLVKKGVVMPVNIVFGETSYVPYSDPEKITIKNISDYIEESLETETIIENSEPLSRISKLLQELEKEESLSPSNINLKKLCTK